MAMVDTSTHRCQRFTGVIETLADSEHALARDLAAHRELLSIALQLLHDADRQLHSGRTTIASLHDELRAARRQAKDPANR